MAKFDKDDLVLFSDCDDTYIGKVIITPDKSENKRYTLSRVEFDKLGNAKESICGDVEEDYLTEINYYTPLRAIIDNKYLRQINYLEENQTWTK